MKNLRGVSRLLGGLIGVYVLAAAGSVNADLIVVDATADASCTVPTTSNVCSLGNLSQTMASGVAGDTFEFVYTINDMLHIELGTNVITHFDGFLVKTPASAVVVDFAVTMALSNENGELITELVPIINAPCDALNNCGFVLGPGPTPEFDNVIFHDVHYFWTTSAVEAIPIRIDMGLTGSIAFTSEIGEIGVWTAIHEPSTLALFAIALGGLGFMARRRVA
ncbi:MAG: PEP-CTERM sorting domain-containing protein [Pseudomonadota bacterium]